MGLPSLEKAVKTFNMGIYQLFIKKMQVLIKS
jgi:hypothetical protein